MSAICGMELWVKKLMYEWMKKQKNERVNETESMDNLTNEILSKLLRESQKKPHFWL